MTSRSWPEALFAAILSVVCVFVHASEQSPDIHPTTPYEYWGDYCGYPDVIPNIYEIAGGSLWRMLNAEAMLVRVGQIVPRSDDPNFWRFTQAVPNINYPGSAIPLSGQVPFPGETRLAPNVRTGFLIGPDIISTAAHSNDFNPGNFVVVFNVTAKKDPVTQTCVLPDPEHIPASDIYFPRAVNPLIANTILYYFNIYGAWTGVDYAAFYLDRPVTGHQYLRIRKNGGISSSDTLALAGHPFGMRTKLQYGIGYAGEAVNLSYPVFTYPTFNDFYLLSGMSGGAVYNLDRNYIETVVGSPTGGGCLGFYTDSFVNPTYYVMYDLCDDVPEPPQFAFPSYHGINEGPISTLADLVPTAYLRVAPLNDVTYVLPVNGTPSPTQTVYTATASANETTTTSILAAVGSFPPNEPSILLSSYGTSLAPGTSTNITATATVPIGTPCGVYDRYVAVVDQTHGFRDRVLHRFEVGKTDFTVTPDTSTDIYAISGPSWPESLAYTLTNTRPTAVSIAVLFDKPWLALSPGSPTFVDLAPAGQTGSTKNVTVTLTSAVSSLRIGDYPFTISFAGQGSCSLNAPIQRAGVFHKGYVLMKKTLDALVFPPTPTNAPITDTFAPNSTFCVSDVKVRFNSERAGTTAGLHWSDWAPSVRIYLDRVGAETTSSQLWNLNPLPAGWTVPTYDGPDSTSIETLLLDRSQHVPPVGIASLNAFNGKSAAGQWTFRLFDDGIQTINTGILESWELELRGSNSCLSSGG